MVDSAVEGRKKSWGGSRSYHFEFIDRLPAVREKRRLRSARTLLTRMQHDKQISRCHDVHPGGELDLSRNRKQCKQDDERGNAFDFFARRDATRSCSHFCPSHRRQKPGAAPSGDSKFSSNGGLWHPTGSNIVATPHKLILFET